MDRYDSDKSHANFIGTRKEVIDILKSHGDINGFVVAKFSERRFGLYEPSSTMLIDRHFVYAYCEASDFLDAGGRVV